MKKVTLFALLMGAALCASAVTPISTKVTQPTNAPKGAVVATRANGLVPQAIAVQPNVMRGAKAISEATTWDFEDESQFAQFTIVDSDGDGFNWEYYNMTGVETGRMTPHSGEGLISSKSYDNDGAGALTPDNWLISPEVTLGGAVKFFAAGQDASYASEVFGLYVCVGDPSDVANFVQIGADITATGEYVEYEFDLSAYAGQNGYFAIRHYHVTDMFMLNVDDITFDPNAVAMNEPGVPTDLDADPTATTADISWTPGSDNVSANLRYREYVDVAETNRFIDLPYDEEIYMAQLDGVYIYDADGDGGNWGLAINPKDESDLCFVSASYDYNYGGALTPDNWLIFPAKLGGSLKFTAMNYSSSYLDNLGVFVATGDDIDALIQAGDAALTQVNTDFAPVYNEWTPYEFDLSAFEGMGYIIIRHYNCTDMWRLYVDDIDITVPDPKDIPDWTVVEDVESPYTIDGLTPETDYEVQVQGVNRVRAEGDKVSAWSETLIFTTLAEGDEAVYYLVGFNDWSNPLELVEEGVTVDVLQQDFENTEDTAQEFKVITYDANGGEVWFGGIDENQAGFFLIDEGLLDQNITLDTEGSNFRLSEPGNYTIKLVKEPIKAPVEGLKLLVTKNEITAIETVKSDVKGDNNYYNLMGQKMNANNLPAGIYIHNGKKIVVK